MLVYHPAFDIYNGAFRMLRILYFMKQSEVELDRIRIWDFYLTFPNEVSKITFPQDLIKLKKIFKDRQNNPYEDIMDPRKIAERMRPYQISALKYLVSHGLIDSERFLESIVKRTDKTLPKTLEKEIIDISTEQENIIKLVQGFGKLTLWGLKERTGILEFRYDSK